MRQLHDRPAPSEEEELSFARAAAFFITLAIVAVLALVGSAQAAPQPSGPLASASAEEDEAAEETFDFGAEEGEEPEACAEELEDGEWEVCEAATGAATESECVVESAAATISASESGKLRLSIRYRSASPALVSVGYRLRGGKGSLSLGTERTRFGRSGVFRDTETLAEEQIEKVLAAKEFRVELYAVNSPRRCRDELERHLTLRKAVPGGVLWAEPSARQGRL